MKYREKLKAMGVKTTDQWSAPIDRFIVDWAQNRKWAPYEYDGEPCCFSVDDIADLIAEDGPESILQHGLFKPIMVEQCGEGAAARFNVVAGFRRMRAFLELRDRGRLNDVPGTKDERGARSPSPRLGRLPRGR